MAPIAISPVESQVDVSAQKNLDSERRDSTSPLMGVGGRKMPQRKRTIDMNDGHEIPQIALGVYKAPNGQETEDAILAALDAGYRHIDSAARYMNEEACGRAVKTWCDRTGTPRSEIFITTKLWDADHGYESAFNALVDSLKKFGLEYFDLYLLHSPAECPQKRLDSWRALETAQKLGIVKSIGVSNFGAQDLEHLIENSQVLPCVNQIEVHPFGQRKDLVGLCEKHNIRIEAYSPLARGNKLNDPRIGEIAERLGKTPAQVLINWSAARGNVVLPKSMTASRIQSNFDSFDFDLSAEDMATIDSLEENYVTGSLHKSED